MNGKSFGDFWREIRKPILKAYLRIAILMPVVTVLVVLGIRLYRCGAWNSQAQAVAECGAFYSLSIMAADIVKLYPTFLMIVVIAGIPISFLQILYLEWDKYKKDKPSGFTHEKGCEGPPGYTRRLAWVTATSWNVEGSVIEAIEFDERRKRYQGPFNEEALIRSLRRKFARTENKPLEDTDQAIRWRIVQNNGREVHIHLKRQAGAPPMWVMTTEFYEWAGRKNPPVLVQTHTTEFVPQV